MKLISPLPKISFENFSVKLSSVDDLPTLPVIVNRILKAADDCSVSASDLKDIIINDQSLSAKVLKVANSAFYGMRYKVTSVENAVSVIGFDEVKRIAISVFVVKSFPSRVNIASFPLEKFWVHSVAVANISRMLLDEEPEDVQTMIFTAGLLHDIGKLLFCQYLAKHFFLIVHYTQKHNLNMIDVEKEIAGIHHGDGGNILATIWDLPPVFSKIIQFHNQIEKVSMNDKSVKFISSVNIADTMARRLQIGFSGNTIIPEYDSNAMDALMIDSSSISLIEQLVDSKKSSFELF